MNKHELQTFADKLRYEAFRMVYEAGDGHPGPAFSIADIIAVLYANVMRIDPERPDWVDRDRLILSKGHACPIVYAALSECGYFGKPVEHFHLRELHSMFQGHPVPSKTPGIDMTSGSLGNGLAMGAGMALSAKMNGQDYRTYVIAGDGEIQEGVVWEGANIAAHHKLDNLTLIVDSNGWQSGGSVAEVGGAHDIGAQFAAFGWNVMNIDGHDYEAIEEALKQSAATKGKPSAIVCRCIKGKGLSFMEDNNDWHKNVPNDEQFAAAKVLLGKESA